MGIFCEPQGTCPEEHFAESGWESSSAYCKPAHKCAVLPGPGGCGAARAGVLGLPYASGMDVGSNTGLVASSRSRFQILIKKHAIPPLNQGHV